MGGRVGDPGPLPPILHPCPKGERLRAGLADQGLSHVESGVGHPEPPNVWRSPRALLMRAGMLQMEAGEAGGQLNTPPKDGEAAFPSVTQTG